MTATVSAQVRVDGLRSLGPIRRVWASIGYDELNWTYTPRGKALYRTLGDDVFTGGPYYVRMHNTFTSGSGLSRPAGGGGNPYHEMPDGTVRYYWEFLDRTFDTIVNNGGVPLVELGFMPRDLSRATVPEAVFGGSNDLGVEPYESGAWKAPPKDLGKWGNLIAAFVAHCVERYGAARVETWRFELWNEPDIRNYWHGTFEEYAALYDVTAAAVKRACPAAAVGGPATTDHGTDFLARFLDHVEANGVALDFLSFHTKGAYFTPRRVYNPFLDVPKDGPSAEKMLDDIRRNLAAIAAHPHFADLPVYVDECDPAVGTIYGVHDNPNFVVTNTEHYASIVCHLAAALLNTPQVERMTHWAFYMEGKRWFEGNRTLVDNENVEKPILNGLRLLERLAGGERLAATTDAPGVGALAVRLPGMIRILLWHHDDVWWEGGQLSVDLTVADVADHGAARVWRLDHNHANTHTAWRECGAPDDPTPEQVGAIRAAGELRSEPLESSRGGGTIHMRLDLLRYGVALVEVATEM
ncbi:MAG: glycoside hydrolase [Chloroflexota bacterium]|nr:glycoside hydrolase [Chloroflexota bacterium]